MHVTDVIAFDTRSGIQIDVRPATEDDAPALAAFFDRVSDEDRRFRFLAAARHLSRDQLDPLIHADHFRSESYLAFNRADGSLVASALLACDAPLDTAEIAISIHRDYRGKGIGWALLDLLTREAEARGVRRVITIEDRQNRAAIGLEREKGFVPEAVKGDPALVVLSKTFR
jgi:acetyltransferase